MRAKLDGAGCYDEFEVDRVVAVEMKGGAKQSELVKALEPVADRLMRRYRQARERERTAAETGDTAAAEDAKAQREALLLFRTDMQTFLSAYTFLSQIFDYGNSDLEKRAIFFKRLLPLLEFDREREGIDLSKVTLTHHSLRNRGSQPMPLADGDSPMLKPLTDIGSGSVQEKERALLAEIIERVNDLFAGDMTDGDKLVYVNNVLKGKLLETELLVQQAQSNSKEQFAHSPDLDAELMNAILDAYAAHTAMSKQAIDSEQVRQGLIKEALLGPAQLYEALRARGVPQSEYASR